VCETGASALVPGTDNETVMTLDRSKCVSCMKCVEACLSGARELVGLVLSMEDIIHEAVADRLFFKNSGGGITISGGEPLFFPEFTLALSRQLKRDDKIHLAIETSCFASWTKIKPLLEYIDLFIVDIKTLNSQKHRQTIGSPLEIILENIDHLITNGAKIRIHLPVIPGFNDSQTDYEACHRYLSRFSDKIAGVDILPFHCYGAGKYTHLGRGDTYKYQDVKDLNGADVLPLSTILKKAGIKNITIGGLVGMGKGPSETKTAT
jgi:pyruvate formate lyase activating enzyme